MILQVSDQFIDELLNEDVGNEGSVADLISGREQSENAENLEMHSASFLSQLSLNLKLNQSQSQQSWAE